jgi:uncharacterized protein YukE
VTRTSEQRLRELHQVLTQAAGQLAEVRAELRRTAAQSVEYWEGNAAETFRNHVGDHYRIHHLAEARRRLLEAATVAAAAADEAQQGRPGSAPAGPSQAV